LLTVLAASTISEHRLGVSICLSSAFWEWASSSEQGFPGSEYALSWQW
jgi:hypothetical protein